MRIGPFRKADEMNWLENQMNDLFDALPWTKLTDEECEPIIELLNQITIMVRTLIREGDEDEEDVFCEKIHLN